MNDVMKKQMLILSSLLLAMILVVGVTSCKKSSTEETTTFSLSTLKAGDIDLNAAIPPSNVPATTTITAVFNMAVNPSTATSSTISLVQSYDTTDIAIGIAVSGGTITITPTNPMAGGAGYILQFKAGIKATDGQGLAAFNRAFTTVGTFVPTGVIAYWNFENNGDDQIGTFPTLKPAVITNVTYVASRNAAAGQAAKFDGATSLIEIPNGEQLMNTGGVRDFSLSFWIYEDSTGRKDQFTMGLAAWYGFQFEVNNNGNGGLGECKLAAQYSLSDGTSTSQDLWFNGADTNTTLYNGGWKGWTYCRDLQSSGGTGVNGLLAKKWASVVCTYNHTTKVGNIYINGQIMKSQDFNLYGTDHPLYNATGLKYAGNAGNNMFVFGFIQDKNDPTIPDGWAQYSDPNNNHFKGMFDDVRFFQKVLTPNEISLMYNSEKP
jgi:hypothetical protein